MNDLIIPSEEVPEIVRAWLKERGTTAVLAAIEEMPDGNLLVRDIPDIDPAFVMRVRETFAKYRESLMNLT
jgi:hypothetical protein